MESKPGSKSLFCRVSEPQNRFQPWIKSEGMLLLDTL